MHAAVGRQARDGPGRRVRVPDAALGVDVEPERLEVRRPLRQALESTVTVHPDRIRHLDGEPDRPVRPDRDGRRDVGTLEHLVLDESRIAPGPHEEGGAGGETDDDRDGQPPASTPGSGDRCRAHRPSAAG